MISEKKLEGRKVAENKLSIEQLKQIREAFKLVQERDCPRDYALKDFCDSKDCFECWLKTAENELEKRGAGE